MAASKSRHTYVLVVAVRRGSARAYKVRILGSGIRVVVGHRGKATSLVSLAGGFLKENLTSLRVFSLIGASGAPLTFTNRARLTTRFWMSQYHSTFANRGGLPLGSTEERGLQRYLKGR